MKKALSLLCLPQFHIHSQCSRHALGGKGMSRYPPLSPSRHVMPNSLCKKRSTEKKFHECAIETKNSTSVQDEIGETVLFHADIYNSQF